VHLLGALPAQLWAEIEVVQRAAQEEPERRRDLAVVFDGDIGLDEAALVELVETEISASMKLLWSNS
jgi:hypothetical protein